MDEHVAEHVYHAGDDPESSLCRWSATNRIYVAWSHTRLKHPTPAFFRMAQKSGPGHWNAQASMAADIQDAIRTTLIVESRRFTSSAMPKICTLDRPLKHFHSRIAPKYTRSAAYSDWVKGTYQLAAVPDHGSRPRTPHGSAYCFESLQVVWCRCAPQAVPSLTADDRRPHRSQSEHRCQAGKVPQDLKRTVTESAQVSKLSKRGSWQR